MQDINVLEKLKRARFNFPKGLATGSIFLVITGSVTGLLPNPFYIRMVPITLLDYFFLATTSLFAGLYFGREQCTIAGDRLAKLGGLTGFLAFSCPVCNAVFLAFLSSSAIMSYIDPLRPFLGVVSTAMLAAFIYRDFR